MPELGLQRNKMRLSNTSSKNLAVAEICLAWQPVPLPKEEHHKKGCAVLDQPQSGNQICPHRLQLPEKQKPD